MKEPKVNQCCALLHSSHVLKDCSLKATERIKDSGVVLWSEWESDKVYRILKLCLKTIVHSLMIILLTYFYLTFHLFLQQTHLDPINHL